MTPPLSVLVVTYNSAKLLADVLESVLSHDGPLRELIVVDNASTDDSLAIARSFEPRGARVMAAGTNRGFAGGNNDAARAATAPVLLLLNPDAILEPGALAAILDAFARNPRAGILGARVTNLEGTHLLHCGGLIGVPPHCRHLGHGEPDSGQNAEPLSVEYVTGACLAIRRTVWDELGGLDEDYRPAYYEDVDLCARARHAGHTVLYWPALRARHHETVSSEFLSPAFLTMYHRNRLRYARKVQAREIGRYRAARAEILWFLSHESKGVRRIIAPVYAEALLEWFLEGGGMPPPPLEATTR